MKNMKSNGVNFSLGVLFALGVVFIAFEWSTETYVPKPIEDREVYNVWTEEYPPVPILEKKTKPAFAPPPQLINLIDIKVVDNADPEPEDQLETTEDVTDVPDIPDFYIPQEDVVDNTPYVFAQNMPVFPGGEEALQRYLASSIDYPQMAIELEVQGRVHVQFIIEKDGSVSNVAVLKGVDPLLDRESIRVVKSMPAWTPGRQNGKAVRVKMSLPVYFILN